MNDFPTTILIFGASGDLTRRKLIPALYNLRRKGRLADDTNIVGYARRPYNDQDFRIRMQDGIMEFSQSTYAPGLWGAFAPTLRYFQGDLSTEQDFIRLQNYLQKLESGPANRLYYLATSPTFYEKVVSNLGAAGMVSQESGQRNIIIEKPFGMFAI